MTAARKAWARFRLDALPSTRFNLILLGALIGVYALTRLIALDQFPIYFFSDEASIALIGRSAVQNGFVDGAGQLLPVYFEALNASRRSRRTRWVWRRAGSATASGSCAARRP